MTNVTISDDIRLKIDRWLEGDLPEADEAALRQALENDPASVAHLADRAVLHGLLRETGGRAVVVKGHAGSRRTFGLPVAGIAAAVVACVVLAGLTSLRQAAAGPVAVVQKALEACRTLPDRRYSVRIEPARPPLRGSAGRPLSSRESMLWTRDARFVQSIEVSGRNLVWGRDVRGAVWFAVSRRVVAVFESDEVPESLRDACDLRTLDLQALLASLLAEFDLERTRRTASTETIVARPRRGADKPTHGAVEIEVERDSLLVKSIVLERLHREELVATVRLTLEEIGRRPDSLYLWQDHVDPDAEVHARSSRPGARRKLLAEFLGLMRRGAGGDASVPTPQETPQ